MLKQPIPSLPSSFRLTRLTRLVVVVLVVADSSRREGSGMERWERTTVRRGQRPTMEPTNNPSFSSSLLDAIYRSIDEGDDVAREDRKPTRRGTSNGAARKTDFSSSTKCFADRVTNNATVSEKVVLRQRDYGGTAEYHRRRQTYWRELQQQQQRQRERRVINSTSSSSESSYGCSSSSEAESVRMKPTKTNNRPQQMTETRKPRHESKNSIRSRFRASKIYGELKKAKAPVSPGGRLASFINQLFSSSGDHLKKVKTTSPPVTTTAGDESTCSSASSYSRSCLSKTPSSCRPDGGPKRSVRFYPVSIVVGDDLRPCGQKCVDEDNDHAYNRFDIASLPSRPPVVKNPAPMKEVKQEHIALGFGDNVDNDDDDDDDAASYSSSDLFELENLTAVGGDELPVYETTHVHTNRAIAQGLIM